MTGCGSSAGGGGCCARFSAALLAQVNILLVLFSGAALGAAARLKWDPSAYLVLREAAPREYRAACGALLAGALATLLLAQLAMTALLLPTRSHRLRPALLYIYAVLMLALIAGEVGGALWAYLRVREWIDSRDAQELLELMQARDHILAALQLLARWFPLPEKLNALIQEAQEDIPRNAYAAGGAAVALLALQAAAIVLAVCAGCARSATHTRARASHDTLHSDPDEYFDRDDSRSRLTFESHTKYYVNDNRRNGGHRNGQLVMV